MTKVVVSKMIVHLAYHDPVLLNVTPEGTALVILFVASSLKLTI